MTIGRQRDSCCKHFMTLGFKFNVLPELLAGETVLYFKKWVWGISCKSLPTYRLFFSFPPLWEAGLYITDRRIILMAHCFRLLTQEFSLWFPGKTPSGDAEWFKAVCTGLSGLAGDYLELISENPNPQWYRSRELRLRFFMRHPHEIEQIINEAEKTG